MTHGNFARPPGWVFLLLLATLAGCDRTPETFLVGTLERDRIELKVESSEPILAIEIQDGQRLEAGDPVLRQDPARAEARLAQAEAQRDQATARLAELQRGPRPEVIAEARANLDAARAARINAEAELQRTRDVFARGLSTQERLDRAQAEFDSAAARERAATDNLERLLNGTTAEELMQAEAAVRTAQAQVESARLDRERTQLRAPVAGRVDKLLYQVGERPPAGTTVAVLLDERRVFARVYVSADQRASLAPGAQFRVRIDGFPDSFEGRLRWVSADAAFTPYFALTEHDRSRLSYLAEIDVPGAAELPSGVALQATRAED